MNETSGEPLPGGAVGAGAHWPSPVVAPSLRAVIADDERLMREQLRRRLSQAWPDLQIVGEAVNGEAALDQILECEPDIAFLDIRMPGLSGIEVARRLAGRCSIVFITAYDEYALQAFEEGAIDYVVKPVDAQRLARTAARLRDRLSPAGQGKVANDQAMAAAHAHTGPPASPPLPDELVALARRLGLPAPARPQLVHIQASVGQSIRLIPIADVLYFNADDRYTRVRTLGLEALIRKPIRELLIETDPSQFWQIHRSTLVNISAIASVVRDEAGRRFALLNGLAERLEISRAFSHRFRQM